MAEPFDPEAIIEAIAPVLGLDVAAEYRAGIVLNLVTAAQMAALMEQVLLEDEAEPAPVFVP